MMRGLTSWVLSGAVAAAALVAAFAGPDRLALAANGGGKGGGGGGADAPLSPVKPLLADELNQLERELAGRMMRRADLQGDRRARNELDIDMRIIQRSLVALAAEAPFATNDQATAWLRAKQFRDALKGMEDALGQDAAAGHGASQKPGRDPGGHRGSQEAVGRERGTRGAPDRQARQPGRAPRPGRQR